MSASTCSLNFVGISKLAMLLGPGFCHSRHMRQVSTMDGISLRTISGVPAARRVLSILLAEACHHRRCSLRRSRRDPASVATRRARRVALISKRDQSCVDSPVPASRHVRRTRDTESGPRPPAGGAGTPSEADPGRPEPPSAAVVVSSAAASSAAPRSGPGRPAVGSSRACILTGRG